MLDTFDLAFREESIKQRKALLDKILSDHATKTAFNNIQKLVSEAKSAARPVKRRRHFDDETFHCNISVPLEKRKSLRLLNVPPEFSYLEPEYEDDRGQLRNNNNVDDWRDLEKPVFKHKRTIPIIRRNSLASIVPVDEITKEYLDGIAKSSVTKILDPNTGTSCHQCRQKTKDSKTYCRSGKCIGVRGQFCGPCLMNRYGEDASVALLDPNWWCPLCRGICNCSLCRSREGKRPTGILAPMAFSQGYASVHHFLKSLGGLGDYEEKELEDSLVREEKAEFELETSGETVLLGFSSDGLPLMQSKSLYNLGKNLTEHELLCTGFGKDLDASKEFITFKQYQEFEFDILLHQEKSPLYEMTCCKSFNDM